MSRPSPVAAVLALSASLAACSGDDGDDGQVGDGTCALAATTTGALAWSTGAPPACAIPFAGATGARMWFYPLDGPVGAFVVDVPDLAAGAIGDFPASVDLQRRGGDAGDASGEWTTPPTCTVTVDANDFVSDDGFTVHHQLAGRGTCPEAAVRPGGLEPVSIEPFTFRFPAHWNR